MILNPDQYSLPEAVHQDIFEKYIIPHILVDVKPSGGSPIAIIVCGQPGAGKSMVSDDALQEVRQRGGAAYIVGDDLRGYHPHYDNLKKQDDKTAAFYTDRDTAKWIEKSIAYAKEQGINIVIETTGRNTSKVAKTMADLRNVGYEIDVRALAVNDKLSWQGVLHRYESQKADKGTGRMTLPEAHHAAYQGLPRTLEHVEREKLADRITLYRRGGEIVYSSTLNNGVWTNTQRVRDMLEAERARPMTVQEYRDYIGNFDRLTELLARPERKASPEEIQQIDDLRQSAREELATIEKQNRGYIKNLTNKNPAPNSFQR